MRWLAAANVSSAPLQVLRGSLLARGRGPVPLPCPSPAGNTLSCVKLETFLALLLAYIIPLVSLRRLEEQMRARFLLAERRRLAASYAASGSAAYAASGSSGHAAASGSGSAVAANGSATAPAAQRSWLVLLLDGDDVGTPKTWALLAFAAALCWHGIDVALSLPASLSH